MYILFIKVGIFLGFLFFFFYCGHFVLFGRIIKSKHNWLGRSMLTWKSGSVVFSVVFDSLGPHGLYPTRLLSPWNFPGKNMGVGSHSLLQRILLTWISNHQTRSLHCRQILYIWATREAQVLGYSFFKKYYTIFKGYFPFKVITK